MDKLCALQNELIELAEISKEILPYYDLDKIKYNSVYIWTKGEDGKNVFDIQADKIVFYEDNHKIIEEAKFIIKRIQRKLRKIELL